MTPISKMIDNARRRLDVLSGEPGSDFCQAFDRVLSDLEDEASLPVFLKYASPDPAVREAGHRAEAELGAFMVDVFSRQDLHDALRRTPIGSGELLRLREKLVEGFRRGGLSLPPEKRAELTAVLKKLVELHGAYSKNLNDVADFLAVTEQELDGLPADFVARLQKLEDGRRKVTLDYPDSLPFMAHARSREARRKLWLLLNRRAPQNSGILKEILALRRRQAALHGKPTFAHLELEDRMAKGPQTVAAFLDRLKERAVPKAAAERARLLELLRTVEPGAERLEPWDMPFVQEMARAAAAFDELELAEYFPLERSLAGLLGLCEGLFGLRFKPVAAPEAWELAVRPVDCMDAATGEMLGRFYLDFFPRDGKYKHAAVFQLLKPRIVEGVRRPGSAAMLVNFPEPAAGKPSLLRHAELLTLFHEFGHVLHAVLSRAPYGRYSGTRVARDFLETPSQILENWAWDRVVLEQLSAHWDTKKPVPDALLDKLLASRRLNTAVLATRQLAFASIDQSLHGYGEADAGAVFAKLYGDLCGVQYPPDVCPEASFSHLLHYAAAYYGYLWSEVYACDMFSVFEKQGVLDPATGLRFRRTILEPGGSREEGSLVREFLGREPDEKAFLAKLGLS